MSHDRQSRRHSLLRKREPQVEPKLFGGYHPLSGLLVISVEAASGEEARERISAVAHQVNVNEVAGLLLLEMDSPSREVPLFMDGYFEATGFVTKKDNSRLQMVRDANSPELMT